MRLFYSTFENKDSAKEIAAKLLGLKLIKCANIIDKALSIYIWKEQLNEGSEALVLFKVSDSEAQSFEENLTSIHPYDTPCIIELSTDGVNLAFNKWINSSH